MRRYAMRTLGGCNRLPAGLIRLLWCDQTDVRADLARSQDGHHGQ
jgi:hypothetical protein